MRCLSCQRLSIDVICSFCSSNLLQSSIKREKIGSVDTVSLFAYSTIESFILTKYQSIGYRVYRYFAKRFVREFLLLYQESLELKPKRRVLLVGVDEVPKSSGFSQTAVLAHYGATDRIVHQKSALIAKNATLSYAGKSRSFRLNNPRDFQYSGLRDVDIVLIDDVVTTGTTLNEAKKVITEAGANLLFALVLADAKR